MRTVALAFLAALTSTAHARPPPACGHLDADLSYDVFPANGAVDVPTNTSPVVGAISGTALAVANDGLVVVDDAGKSLPFDFETIAVRDGFGVTPRLGLLKMRVPFVAGAHISVTSSFEPQTPITSFTVGTRPVLTTPSAPSLVIADASLCGAQTDSIQATGAAWFIAAIDRPVPTSLHKATVDGASLESGLVYVDGQPHQTVKVAGVDLAGHIGPSASIELPVPPPRPQFPTTTPSGGGCGGSASGAMFVSLFALRRRRLLSSRDYVRTAT
jgi:hypothetical protein